MTYCLVSQRKRCHRVHQLNSTPFPQRRLPGRGLRLLAAVIDHNPLQEETMAKTKASIPRRQFLSRVSSASVALALSSSLRRLGLAQPRKLGIALLGLGRYASGQLAPALQETKNCYLAGIVTGHPEKAAEWTAKY